MVACVAKAKIEMGNAPAAGENAVTRGAGRRGLALDVEIPQYYDCQHSRDWECHGDRRHDFQCGRHQYWWCQSPGNRR